MKFSQLVRSRRSIRVYQDEPIPQDTLRYVLEQGRWGPSAHNRQPWRFAVITTPSIQVALAKAMGARLREDLSRDSVPEAVIKKDVNRSYSRITGAAALICVCMSMVDMDTYPDPVRDGHERTMAIQSVAMASQNMLLAAHEVGLGACWMCAPLFCPDVVRMTLDLANDWEPQGLISLGYPAQERERTRHEIDNFTCWL